MLIGGAVIGFIAALALGGRASHLVDLRLRLPLVVLAALLLRYGTELALERGLAMAETFRLPLFALAFGLLVAALYANRPHPGLLVVAAGVAANAAAILVNGGWMPIWTPALAMAGLGPGDVSRSFQALLPAPLDGTFLSHAGFLGDVLPAPVPYLANVYSVGDLFIAVGLGWFVFATMIRRTRRDALPAELDPRAVAATLALGGPTLLGGAVGATVPTTGYGVAPGAAQTALPGRLGRLGRHPYVRLALDARFSALWVAQTISLFGDRLHQVALGVLVLAATGSALATGLVFLVASLPNLLLGPIAGTFVDRWNQKNVLVAGDFLRAALVLLMPLAAIRDIRLVYPLVFLVTCVSIFFRPAKDAVIPRIVARQDLMAANSANWLGETLADIAGYPLAGFFVALLGSRLPIAFWVDAGTYLVSGALILGLTIPPVIRAADAAGSAVRRFFLELLDGWRFLRGQPALLQNTLVTALAQGSFGVQLALTIVYARTVLDGSVVAYPASYSLIDAAIGVGNLVGGLAVGLIGARIGKGWLIAAGLALVGFSLVAMGLTTSILVAVAGAAVMGVANLVFIIPTQTLFAELTPRALMGRVVAIRSSLVYGSMMLAMGSASVVAERVPVSAVFVAFGLLTAACGAAAVLLPAIRKS